MRNLSRNVVAVALLCIGSIGVATAAELNLTAAQKQAIVQSVLSEKGQPAPAGFLPKVGAAMPKSVSLQHLPASVAAQVPGAKDLEYVKFETNEILLVEAKDRKVAGIIAPSGTTGAAPAAASPAPAATSPAPATTSPAPAATSPAPTAPSAPAFPK
jgi:peptidoglycan DL-endopeptidase CwlO